MPSIEISHNLDFGPGLPQDVLEVAEKQGEDPARVCAMIQEFKDMIYGKYSLSYLTSNAINYQIKKFHLNSKNTNRYFLYITRLP